MAVTISIDGFRKAYFAAAKVALDAASLTNVGWPNREFDPTVIGATSSDVWLRATLIHGTTLRAALAPALYRRTGFASFQIFGREGRGTDAVYAAATVAQDFLEDADESGAILNARFQETTPSEIGLDQGDLGEIGGARIAPAWWQMNVAASFLYDTLRTP